MKTPLEVLPQPCTTCPYRRDTAPGIWAADEYQKLPAYDDGAMPPALAIFMCHHGPLCGKQLVCRGWLSVHAESIAARLAVARGEVRSEDRHADVLMPLYATGAEACAAGMAGVNRPKKKARQAVARITKKRGRCRNS